MLPVHSLSPVTRIPLSHTHLPIYHQTFMYYYTTSSLYSFQLPKHSTTASRSPPPLYHARTFPSHSTPLPLTSPPPPPDFPLLRNIPNLLLRDSHPGNLQRRDLFNSKLYPQRRRPLLLPTHLSQHPLPQSNWRRMPWLNPNPPAPFHNHTTPSFPLPRV